MWVCHLSLPSVPGRRAFGCSSVRFHREEPHLSYCNYLMLNEKLKSQIHRSVHLTCPIMRGLAAPHLNRFALQKGLNFTYAGRPDASGTCTPEPDIPAP